MRYFIKNYKKFYIPLIAVAVFSIISYYLLFYNVIGVKNAVIKANEQKSDLIRYQVEEYLGEKHKLLESIMQLISSMEEKKYSQEEINVLLKDIIQKYPDINSLSKSNRYGDIVMFISNNEMFKPDNYLGLNISHRTYFQAARLGKKTTFKLLNDLVTNKEILIISIPHYDKNGFFKGTIAFSINKDYLLDTFENYNVDDKDYVVLLNTSSEILYHPHLEKARKSVSESNFLESLIYQINRNNKGTMNLLSELDNQQKIISYSAIKNTDWAVLSVKHISKVYTPLVKQLVININIIVIVALSLYLILRSYFLQMKREEDFLVYNMERIQMLGQISAGIAHEIRNPLSSIKGYIQIEHTMNPTELSNIALTEMKKIEESLNYFLKLSKPLEEGKKEFYPHDVIKEIGTILEAIGLLKDINIKYNIDNVNEKIKFNKDYLRFIILNLVQKLCSEIEKGQTLNINLKSQKQSVVYEIENGKIPNDKNLDLEISKKIIQSEGGQIIVENKGYFKIAIIIPQNKN
ncbi:Signal transduction histidine kinase regulating C4-dicarboxylate transport system [Alkalithermobacter thermoalcaliphilus JW-YL-7 = DSM 7308]|uniref:histidine kinase n=1 Tax=Alkalithermobacter thermoalcaliphilus JW-YL-7 = DSM 7308 TaxID=1121328 RepID=A0A150FSL9_CLOPD|nr:putative cache sensor protein [[Clostridium] paradoxum JW-YL-7 = DSM 7308]SHK68865.1 Signal transduction histidine kinase regulating C4-dicarboxylate transport system [[Clostridium] paradoxum JW-YL-7 = DSM 7308]